MPRGFLDHAFLSNITSNSTLPAIALAFEASILLNSSEHLLLSGLALLSQIDHPAIKPQAFHIIQNIRRDGRPPHHVKSRPSSSSNTSTSEWSSCKTTRGRGTELQEPAKYQCSHHPPLVFVRCNLNPSYRCTYIYKVIHHTLNGVRGL